MTLIWGGEQQPDARTVRICKLLLHIAKSGALLYQQQLRSHGTSVRLDRWPPLNA
jgi:hypothetical protein